VSGVPHAPFRPLTKPVMQLPGNRLGYGAFMRALLVALFEWVEHGTAPPDSRFPSRAAGTLVTLAEARRTFPRLPEVKFPNFLNELRLRDHSVERPSESTAYPVFVQSTDADGNALGGIRHPLLAAPQASSDLALSAAGRLRPRCADQHAAPAAPCPDRAMATVLNPSFAANCTPRWPSPPRPERRETRSSARIRAAGSEWTGPHRPRPRRSRTPA
jgi:hypothetical protein